MTAVLLENQEWTQDKHPDDGAASADLHSVSDPADGFHDVGMFQETLRAVAETQRGLVAGREGSGRRKLAQIRFEEHSGVVTATQYKLWKRWVYPVKKSFNDLSDSAVSRARQSDPWRGYTKEKNTKCAACGKGAMSMKASLSETEDERVAPPE